MLDVIDAIRELFEPPATTTVEIDESGAEPFMWRGNSLYVFPSGADVHSLIGAGDCDREDFEVIAVYIADSLDEEAQQRRLRGITSDLDTKAHAYTAVVAANRNRTGLWDALHATVDHDFIRALQVRGVAVRVTGYRLI